MVERGSELPAKLRLGIIGVGDGRELEAALSAERIEIAGFWGEDLALMSELAAHYGLLAVASWRHLLTADALYVGGQLSDPATVLKVLAAGRQHLLLAPDLLACPGAFEWLQPLMAGERSAAVARVAQVDDGLGYCRQLTRAGQLGELLGLSIRLVEANVVNAWTALADQLGTALWVAGLELLSARWVWTQADEALHLSVLIDTVQGVPVTVQLLAGVPGGAHDDLLASRLLGSRGQLILMREPLGWFTAATESNTARRWEKLVYAGEPGSLQRTMDALAASLRDARTTIALPEGELKLAALLTAMQNTNKGGWRAD